MLHIQKASAGSGKTFTLARTYIKLFIGKQLEDGTFRLRTPEEVRSQHSHILAVTFTNKATNEMKQRFVEKLADLASEGDPAKIDYMSDFVRDFNTSPEKIRATAHAALTELLNNYTDFQVSTIDSFFQTILRAFVYEADLSESYQLEIDNEFLTRLGVDSTLSLIRGARTDNEIAYWVRKIMKQKAGEGKNWNLLQKEGSAKSELLKFVSEINRENFKKARNDLEEYFDAVPDFRKKMTESVKESDKILINAASEVVELTRGVLDWIDSHNVSGDISANFSRQVNQIIEYKSVLPEFKTRYDGSGKSMPLKASGKKKMEASGEMEELCGLISGIYDSLDKYHQLRILRNEFVAAIPYLGIMRETIRRIAGFREENNLVQLSEINTMLRRIISEDETPFIYERVGSFLNHFLIDEFQDTSEMQWENFSPLLSESLSRDNLNMIIGDAKQSIYRFRDADSSLITHRVPSAFDHILHGESLEENTNWRSSRNVVEFNNSLFSLLAPAIDDPDFPMSVSGAYSGVVQRPSKEADSGYVEFHITDKASENPDETNPAGYVADLVADLIRRGFRQDEIAILVRTNNQGTEVIDSFVRHNRSVEEGNADTVIEFVSEESLKISGARSVGIIVSVLNMIAGDNNTTQQNASDTESESSDFICDLNWYMAENPDDDISDIFEKYFSGEQHVKSLDEMLESMQTHTLPALVESIVAYFVPEKLRVKEAPFIAAFQDKVLDYCDTYPSDISSFLFWWNVNGPKATISSPEGVEAVNVMTIHKSKGLEFRCVIIPELDFNIAPSEQPDFLEKQWVAPCSPFKELFPPVLPIAIRKRLIGTPYEHLYIETHNAIAADSINAFYVAMTRAVDELYVFMPSKSKSNKISEYVRNTLQSLETLDGGQYTLRGGLRMEAEGENGCIYRYGEPIADPAVGRKKKNSEEKEHLGITSYFVNPDLSTLSFREEDLPVADEDDRDPRSAGNVRHSIMQRIRCGNNVEPDLEKALLKVRVSALMMDQEITEFRQLILSQLQDPIIASWFKEGLKVYNERSLMCKGEKDIRPDRFVVSPEGDAIVVDYKFGDKVNPAYRRQVKEYVESLKSTGKFRSVEGFIWYVALRKVLKI